MQNSNLAKNNILLTPLERHIEILKNYHGKFTNDSLANRLLVTKDSMKKH